MGRIVAQVQIAAVQIAAAATKRSGARGPRERGAGVRGGAPTNQLTISGLVDTGAAYLTLPMAWKARFDAFASSQAVEVETASQETVVPVVGDVCGPVRIEIEGFRPIYSEVLFVDMHPENGVYEPLLGYLPLEQSQAAVDMVGHRLVHARRIDLKRLAA